MSLTRIRLGDYIESISYKNIDLRFTASDVRGVNIHKEFMQTKVDLNGRDLSKFQIVNPGGFVFNHRTSRNGSKLSIAYNDSDRAFICTEDYVVFKIKKEKEISPLWLYMYFNRPEFDRYVITNSWGSSTEFFNWDDICSLHIDLPSISIQQKYVDVYKSMASNQQSYENGLSDLKLVCDAYLEELRRNFPREQIAPYIRECNEKNENNEISLFQGINVDHVFIDPKRIAEKSENGSIVRTGQFAFNKVMKAHNTKLPIALREGPDCVVSNSYQVFEVINEDKMLSKYLLLWLNRAETQRYAGFISFGTTRDIFSFEDLGQISISIPKIEQQQCIVDIFISYQERYDINKRLKKQIKDICPILIKGSIEEAIKGA